MSVFSLSDEVQGSTDDDRNDAGAGEDAGSHEATVTVLLVFRGGLAEDCERWGSGG